MRAHAQGPPFVRQAKQEKLSYQPAHQRIQQTNRYDYGGCFFSKGRSRA